jgi:hypothetical protein
MPANFESIEEALKGLWKPSLVEIPCEKVVLCNGAYDAGDVVAEAAAGSLPWVFNNVAKKNGGSGYIVGALLQAETTAIASIFSLFLHSGIPTCALNDDVANTAPLKADRLIYKGRIDFPVCTSIGTGMSETMATPSTYGKCPLPFICKPNSRNLYGVLAIQNALDLADSTVLRISLIVDQH